MGLLYLMYMVLLSLRTKGGPLWLLCCGRLFALLLHPKWLIRRKSCSEDCTLKMGSVGGPEALVP